MPEQFYFNGYKDWVVNAAIVERYNEGANRGAVMIFVQDSFEELMSHKENILARVDRLRVFLDVELRRDQLLKLRLLRTHHLSQGVLDPLADRLEGALDSLKKKDIAQADAHVDHARGLTRLAAQYISRIDPKHSDNATDEKSYDLIDLIAYIRRIWRNFKLVWKGEPYEWGLYAMHAKLLVNGTSIEETDFNFFEQPLKVRIAEDQLHTIFYVIISNTYDPIVLTENILVADLSRAVTEIKIKMINGGRLCRISICDRGKGMPNSAIKKLDEAFRTVRKDPQFRQIDPRKKFDTKIYSKALTYTAGGRKKHLGVGLLSMASAVYSQGLKEEDEGIVIKKNEKHGITIELPLVLEESCVMK